MPMDRRDTPHAQPQPRLTPSNRLIATTRSTAARTMSLTTATVAALALAGLTLTGCTYQVKERQTGVTALEQGNTTRARLSLERALEMRPHDPKAALAMGKLELADNNPVAAERYLEQALVLAEEDGELRQEIMDAMAEALMRQDRAQDLITQLRAAAYDYGDAHDYLRLGRYLTRLGDPDGAQEAFRQARHRVKPGDPAAEIALARFYETFNNHPQALDAWRRAYTIDPTNTTVLRGLRRMGVVPGPTVTWGMERKPQTPAITDTPEGTTGGASGDTSGAGVNLEPMEPVNAP